MEGPICICSGFWQLMPLSSYFLAVAFRLLIVLTINPLCRATRLSLEGILVLPVNNQFNDTTICNLPSCHCLLQDGFLINLPTRNTFCQNVREGVIEITALHPKSLTSSTTHWAQHLILATAHILGCHVYHRHLLSFCTALIWVGARHSIE